MMIFLFHKTMFSMSFKWISCLSLCNLPVPPASVVNPIILMLFLYYFLRRRCLPAFGNRDDSVRVTDGALMRGQGSCGRRACHSVVTAYGPPCCAHAHPWGQVTVAAAAVTTRRSPAHSHVPCATRRKTRKNHRE